MTGELFSPLKRALRVVLWTTSATLGVGLVMSMIVTGPAAPVAEVMVWLGLAMLVTLPILSVVDVLIIEWRLEEYQFAGAAVAVLVMLAFTIVEKLR